MIIDDDYQWDWHGNILTKEEKENLLSASDNETECPCCDHKIKGHLWGDAYVWYIDWICQNCGIKISYCSG